jgi:hypothetical protein
MEWLFLPNSCIDKSHFLQFLTVIDITSINNNVLALASVPLGRAAIHHFLDDIPRWHAELAPLGDTLYGLNDFHVVIIIQPELS